MILINSDTGEALSFGGWCAPSHSPSTPLASLDGRREVFAATAFDHWLIQHGGEGVPIEIHALNHDGNFIIADQASAKIRCWSDHRRGLAFEVSRINITPQASWAVQMIASGRLSKASVFGTWEHRREPRNDGSLLVERVHEITHIALVDSPAYAESHVAIAGASFPGGWRHEAHAAWEESRLSPASYVPKRAPQAAARGARR